MKPVVLSGSWALVTGASSGLGAEFARQLGRAGANLVLSARSRDRLEAMASDLAAVNGIEVRVVTADLGDPAGIDALLSGVGAFDVPIEHVVNNAGFGSAGAFVAADAEAQRRMLRVNVEAPAAIARHFLPSLVERGRGGLIQVASTAAFQPTPLMATYGASKAFLLHFSLALAEELRGSGVRVLALCPGPVPTGFQAVAGVPSTPLSRVAALDAHDVVERALRAYHAGETLLVPGALNSLQTTATRALPIAFAARAAHWTLRALGRG